jgi:hypothetical protein
MEQPPNNGPLSSVGASQNVLFAGDQVRLEGQIDYPTDPAPAAGYPLIFVLPHATSTNRQQYSHISRLGTECGAAVFRWDKRGTGGSGAGGSGSVVKDAVKAYETALAQPQIDKTQVILYSQNEGTSLLGESFDQFNAVQKPTGVVLAGNMLDEKQVTIIKTPIHLVVSKNDWNPWQTYAEAAAKAHNRANRLGATFYVAPNTDRLLMYNHSVTFHRGAASSIQEWICKLCPSCHLPPKQD